MKHSKKRTNFKRSLVLERLKVQLDSGVKFEKGTTIKIPLTKKDNLRIRKEISVLEFRIENNCSRYERRKSA
jgi:hypothetical protein